VSLHPAGHVLGSAQVRMEHGGHVWVASGDYKLQPDPTCAPFEPVRCDTFITESTFGLPIYRWQAPQKSTTRSTSGGAGMRRRAHQRAVLLCLRQGAAHPGGPRRRHRAHYLPWRGAAAQVYRESGVVLPATVMVGEAPDRRP
jgi:putative mRNA 3-end processing factor